jgi:hypothetical protein
VAARSETERMTKLKEDSDRVCVKIYKRGRMQGSISLTIICCTLDLCNSVSLMPLQLSGT